MTVALAQAFVTDSNTSEVPVYRGRASVRSRNPLGSVLVDAAWDHERFYKNVIARAKALGIANSTAELARATGVGHGMLSKWYRGQERPSPKSLQKLSEVLTLPDERVQGKTAYTEFMVLAGHLQPHQVGMAEPPAPPQVVERDQTIVELEQLLSERSKLTVEQKDMLRDFVERAMEGFRPRNGRRRSA